MLPRSRIVRTPQRFASVSDERGHFALVAVGLIDMDCQIHVKWA